MSTRVWWSAGVGLVGVIVLSGCAGTGPAAMPLPPAKMLQPADLASLAGEWQGTLRRGGQGPGPASIAERTGVGRVSIASDGTYTSNFSGAMGTGKAPHRGWQARVRGLRRARHGDALRG